MAGHRAPRVLARDARRARAGDGVIWVGVVEPIDVDAEHQRLGRRDLVVQPAIEESLLVIADIREVAVCRQHKRRQCVREKRRPVLARVVRRGKQKGLIRDERRADRAGVLVQLVRNVRGVDGRERGRCDATRDRRCAEAVGAERRRLPAAGPGHIQSLTVHVVGAGLGDDVQRGASGPAELGGKRVRQHRDFLDGAERYGGKRRLAAPPFIVVGAIEHEGGSAPAAAAGDEVGRVDEEVASAFALTKRGVEQRQRRDLAAQDGRLVDGRAVESAADRRVSAHTLRRAVHGDFGLLGADEQLDLQRRRLGGAQRDVVALFAAEALLRHTDHVGSRQRQRRKRGAAVASRYRRARRAGPDIRHGDCRVGDEGARLVGDEDDNRGRVRGLREDG